MYHIQYKRCVPACAFRFLSPLRFPLGHSAFCTRLFPYVLLLHPVTAPQPPAVLVYSLQQGGNSAILNFAHLDKAIPWLCSFLDTVYKVLNILSFGFLVILKLFLCKDFFFVNWKFCKFVIGQDSLLQKATKDKESGITCNVSFIWKIWVVSLRTDSI